MTFFKLVLSIILTVNYVGSIQVRVDPLVLINQGLVRGEKSISGDSSFLGIPYAQVDTANPFGVSIHVLNLPRSYLTSYVTL